MIHPMSDQSIIIIGASARAAATSARRAGWIPWCADLYGDADLERIALVRKVPAEAYPHGLLHLLANGPPGPLIYTGALENRPNLIARIDRTIWGNPASVLRSVRNPERWTRVLRDDGIASPAVTAKPQSAGSWMLKPRKSAGGVGIQAFTGQPFNVRTHFLQERITGDTCSGIFLGFDRNNTPQDRPHLIGVCQQLIGAPWLNATGFQYAGNIAPMPIDPSLTCQWERIGAAFTSHFGLRGLFGIDAIVRAGVVWPIEINPRYTASMELLERSLGLPLLSMHRAVFEKTSMPALEWPGKPRVWGKAILYARTTFPFPPSGPWQEALKGDANLDETEYADIPHAGEMIEKGHPVLTLFASAATPVACVAALQQKARDLDQRLWEMRLSHSRGRAAKM